MDGGGGKLWRKKHREAESRLKITGGAGAESVQGCAQEKFPCSEPVRAVGWGWGWGQ